MALIIGVLVFAALPAGLVVSRHWRDRPDQPELADARRRHPTSIEGAEPPTTAVRILRSDEEVRRAVERADACAARIADARPSRRYARSLAKPH